MRRLAFFLPLIVAGTATVADRALAQSYPAKPVRMIVSTAAGGSADTLGRLLAQKLWQRSANLSSWKTARAPAASSALKLSRKPRPTAIRLLWLITAT